MDIYLTNNTSILRLPMTRDIRALTHARGKSKNWPSEPESSRGARSLARWIPCPRTCSLVSCHRQAAVRSQAWHDAGGCVEDDIGNALDSR
jgi:hypothetical protein